MYGDLPGKTAADIAKLIVDIFDILRYADIENTFSALCEIYRDETDANVQDKIIKTVQHLAHYDFDVWRQVGPQVQLALVNTIERMRTVEGAIPRAILLTVWREVLDSEVTGTTWTSNSVKLSSGALPVTDEVKMIKAKAMTGLFELYKVSSSEPDKRQIISALKQATRPSGHAAPSKDLFQLTLSAAKQIVDFLTEHSSDQEYQLLEHIEHDLLYDYRRTRELLKDEKDQFSCHALANALVKSIERYRDTINADAQFVRYKTLVGFESTFPKHWHDEKYDYAETEKYRAEQIAVYVEEINSSNEAEWFALIEICAATKSDDMATFPVFAQFLVALAKNRPTIAEIYIRKASDDLLIFLAAFLTGLFESGSEIYQKIIQQYLDEGKHLSSIARHWRNSKPNQPLFITAVLNKAIAVDDAIAVIECLVYSIQHSEDKNTPAKVKLFIPAIEYLTKHDDARWIRGAWFFDNITRFSKSLTTDEAQLLLSNLLVLQSIDYQAERILSGIAQSHADAVLRFFGERLKRRSNKERRERYEAFPHQFHGLEKLLSLNVKPSVDEVRAWYSLDKKLFRFTGGRLLSIIFPNFYEEFSQALSNLIQSGTEMDADFVLAVLENYHGEPNTHEVLKQIAIRYKNDDSKLRGVEISFDNTGVVSGEFGMVEAHREKKEAMKLWLSDPRPEVQAFAERHIRQLDIRIADEQKRADNLNEMRKREFDNEDGDAES